MNSRTGFSQKALSLVMAVSMFFAVLSIGAKAAPQYGETAIVAEWVYGGAPTNSTNVPATGGENADGATLTNWKDAAMTYSSASLVVS